MFYDYPPEKWKDHSPKNYFYLRPDFTFGIDFIEVKDNISGEDWNLSFHALNDNFRISLLRMKTGSIPNFSLDFENLAEVEKKNIKKALNNHSKSNPLDRYYVRWEELIKKTPTPKSNFQLTSVENNGQQFPIKIITGMTKMSEQRLFILDSEILIEWEKIQRNQN